jgi:hypothetical protein
VWLRAYQKPFERTARYSKRQHAILNALGYPDWTGPMELRRVEGAWKVLEYHRDGRPCRPVARSWEEIERGRLRVRPRVVDPGVRVTWLAVEVENCRSTRILVNEVRPRWRFGPKSPAGPMIARYIEPGQRVLWPLLLPRLPRWMRHLRFDVVASQDDEGEVVLVPLNLDLTASREARRSRR